MVKKALIYFIGMLIFPMISIAADFNASVNTDTLGVGEPLILELKLSDASPKVDPDISGLNKDFAITSKQILSNTTIINGSMSSSMSWQYRLVPKKEGKLKIPAITIESSEGMLSSKPISLSIEKGASQEQKTENKDITISARVNKVTPYKNEPIIYTFQLISSQSLTHIQLRPLSATGLVVKAVGKPKVYEKTHNGVPVKVFEAKYILTPLKAGSLTIPGLIIEGEKLVRDENPLDSFLDRNFDPLRLFQKFQTLGGFGVAKLESFSLTSNEIVLDVQAPLQGMISWLPATSLKITENIKETKSLKVGEPFTRIFTIVGEGVTANQLPTLKSQQEHGNDFKVYSDKPTTEESVKDNKLTSWREESYTLIPQEPGSFTLPEITIPWWNVKENKIAYAKIPQRKIEVLPGKDTVAPPVTPTETTIKQENPDNSIPQKSLDKEIKPTEVNSLLLYVSTILLIIIFGFAFFWMLNSAKKKTKFKSETQESFFAEPFDHENFKQGDLNEKEFAKIESAEELQSFLQNYAFQNWHTAKNASLDAIFETAKKLFPSLSQREVKFIINSLHGAIYAEKDISLEEVKERCKELLLTIKNNSKKESKKVIKLPDLNPT
ncbi:MAG: BatD family protein [Alphaproteobacteria bacterium]|nr:BatD family protein [Alphaproteobacteria bacterium]